MADAGVEDAADEAPAFRARESLVVHDAWQITDEATDPFDDRPGTFRCLDGSLGPDVLGEEEVFDFEMATCDYATVMQPTLASVSRGEWIKVRVFHFDLTAPEPAEAHLAIQLGDVTPIDQRIPIPSEGALISEAWQADADVPIGTPVYVHVHNHGDNSWSVIEISVGSERPTVLERDAALD